MREAKKSLSFEILSCDARVVPTQKEIQITQDIDHIKLFINRTVFKVMDAL